MDGYDETVDLRNSIAGLITTWAWGFDATDEPEILYVRGRDLKAADRIVGYLFDKGLL